MGYLPNGTYRVFERAGSREENASNKNLELRFWFNQNR
jgi:hypothetical protein